MITESEIKAIQLAKKVFEHFTHDALPIAREIIALEHELGGSAINVESLDEMVQNDMFPDFKCTFVCTK